MHTPPTVLCFSTNATRLPAFAPWMAARCPPGPEPMTIRSYDCIRGVLRSGFWRGVVGRGVHVLGSISDFRAAKSQRAGGVTPRAIGRIGRKAQQMVLRGKAARDWVGFHVGKHDGFCATE